MPSQPSISTRGPILTKQSSPSHNSFLHCYGIPHLIFYCFIVELHRPVRISSMGNWGRFPCNRVALPNLRCGLGLLAFQLVHRTLTWTTGSLTCVCDLSFFFSFFFFFLLPQTQVGTELYSLLRRTCCGM